MRGSAPDPRPPTWQLSRATWRPSSGGRSLRRSPPATLRRVALLVVFAFVAGAAAAVSPCVLPVLPVALSAGVTGGRRRPLGVVVGLALSFTFATVALVYVIDALGLPDDLVRTLAIVVLLAFGLSLLVPRLGARLEGAIGRLVPAPGPAP